MDRNDAISLRIPVATYRLQLHRGFRFRDAGRLVPYLHRLGVTDIYASPILKARAGSTHGYDITDPTRLNPELGSEDDFDSLSEELKKQDMGLLLDIVPNHLAASPENPWWRDVLEKGKDSAYFAFFDIGWLDFKGSGSGARGYRRFFDIGDLAGVRVEDERVFEATHACMFKLIATGKVTGLRIDHIDGLYDPLEYLRRLQRYISRAPEVESPSFYVVVEKILSGDETLPDTWPVCGTTGYDFTRRLDAFFIDSAGIKALSDIYSLFSGSEKSFRDIVYEKKKQVMRELFPGEIEALGQWLAYLSPGLSAKGLGRALVAVTACLPVYRTYGRNGKMSPQDKKYLTRAFREARVRVPAPDKSIDFVEQVLISGFPGGISLKKGKNRANFIGRWQQLTGAIMAKGFEDTALYNYFRLTSLNEVGGSPDATGLTLKAFHKWNLTRMKRWPDTLNATSTHDTKRSEDVRARISVLSEIPDDWKEHLTRWREWNGARKLRASGQPVPEPNTEILLYQTMLGAWPLFSEEVPGFKERLKTYMIKAVREAKAITSWIKINQAYEDALLYFIDAIFQDRADNEFVEDFLEFQQKIAFYGALNSISRLLLKMTLPGVPDFYQGTELWDFSLVDPDNRRPVDFEKRQRLLDGLIQEEAPGGPPPGGEMLASWKDGRIKLYVTYKVLNARRNYHDLFQKGEHVPLSTGGRRQENICAFARHYGKKWALVAAPRLWTKLTAVHVPPLGQCTWKDDRLILPEGIPGRWSSVLSGTTVDGVKDIALAGLFREFPVAMLISE